MTSEGRRGTLLGWLLVGGGVVAVAAGLAWRSLPSAPSVDLGEAGRQSRSRIEQAVASQARALEISANEAARVRELGAALEMGADRETFQDLLENEEWWAPFRSRFPLSGVIASGRSLVVLGHGAGDLASAEVVRRARERGVSSGLLPGQGRAFLAAAARVSSAHQGADKTVLLLAKPFDSTALKTVADVTGDAVGLSDGVKLLEAAGPGGPSRALAPLLGHEGAGPLMLVDGRVGTAWPVGRSLWMMSASLAPPVPVAPGRSRALVLVGAGGLLALLGVGIALRPAKKQAAAAAPAPAPTARPSQGPRAPEPRRESRPATPVPIVPPARQTPRLPDAAHAPTAAAVAVPVGDGQGSTQMGRYKLLERIGEGGMAEIFFAAAYGAEDFVRHFVVKRLHPHLARRRDAVNQFIDEARLQSRLVHSNIVPVFDFGKVGEEYFLALEYIDGKDVGQLVQRHLDQLARPLDLPIAFFLIHEVLEALGFAHGQISKNGTPLDIVHRDVAPGNVLISFRGEVKLTDFGIAKAEKRVSRTEVGMVKGNAGFMSPEQARGEPVDKRSDIFSAGLVLYYCMTGQSLYRGETTLNRLLRAAVGPATSQFSQIDALPPAARNVLRRALALDPDKRYPTATDFAHDLVAHMGTRTQVAELLDTLFPPQERRDLR